MKICKFGNVAIALLLAGLTGSVQAQDDPVCRTCRRPKSWVDSSMIDRAMSAIGEKYRESAESSAGTDPAGGLGPVPHSRNSSAPTTTLNPCWYSMPVSANPSPIQEENIATLDESIASVEEVTRNIPLLMEKMLAALEEFIELDYPLPA